MLISVFSHCPRLGGSALIADSATGTNHARPQIGNRVLVSQQKYNERDTGYTICSDTWDEQRITALIFRKAAKSFTNMHSYSTTTHPNLLRFCLSARMSLDSSKSNPSSIFISSHYTNQQTRSSSAPPTSPSCTSRSYSSTTSCSLPRALPSVISSAYC